MAMTTKTIKEFQIKGNVELPSELDEKDFNNLWWHFIKQNKLDFKGTIIFNKKTIFVDNTNEPELPFL